MRVLFKEVVEDPAVILVTKLFSRLRKPHASQVFSPGTWVQRMAFTRPAAMRKRVIGLHRRCAIHPDNVFQMVKAVQRSLVTCTPCIMVNKE